MYYVNRILLALFVMLSSQVYAGAGHSHGHGHAHDPISQAEAQKIAEDSIAQLVKKESIEKTWYKAVFQSAEQKEFGGKMEWVVIFKNDKASNTKESMLYIFLTLGGQYIAANYTGE